MISGRQENICDDGTFLFSAMPHQTTKSDLLKSIFCNVCCVVIPVYTEIEGEVCRPEGRDMFTSHCVTFWALTDSGKRKFILVFDSADVLLLNPISADQKDNMSIYPYALFLFPLSPAGVIMPNLANEVDVNLISAVHGSESLCQKTISAAFPHSCLNLPVGS